MNPLHVSVLLSEAVDLLAPGPDENFIDCTLGDGGHTEAILKKTGPKGKVLAIDLNDKAIESSKKRLAKFKDRVIFVQDNFKNLKKIVHANRFFSIHGILLDLGFSQSELRDKERGLSFLADAPLYMRYGGEHGLYADYTLINADITAADIVNNYPQEELEIIFRRYGEERYAGRISRAIVQKRKFKEIKTTFDLVAIIKAAVPKKYLRAKIHPATRVFQALRIAVNDELGNLKQVLPQAVELLESGGRLAVISFHSLEDRIVKQFFKKEATGCLCPKEIPLCRCDHQASIKILTKRVIKPSAKEVKENYSARSAKLRVVEKI